MFNTDGNKTLCNKNARDMAIVTNRGTSQIWTTRNYGKMNTKCSYMHVNNINMTMTEFFFLITLSDSKHRLFTHSFTPRRYNPYRVLADSRSRLQPSLSLAMLFQFLTPSLSASLVTPSIQLRFGLPTRLLPSGLSKVIFLHGRLSCIRTICPAHLSLVILTVVIKSVSSYRRYSFSLYLFRICNPYCFSMGCLRIEC